MITAIENTIRNIQSNIMGSHISGHHMVCSLVWYLLVWDSSLYYTVTEMVSLCQLDLGSCHITYSI